MLEVTVDKFKFRVPETLLFSHAGIWVAVEGSRARLGLSDFAQQVNGDIAFANVKPVAAEGTKGTELDRTEIFTKVALSPRIVVRAAAAQTDETRKRVQRALESALKYSLVANSIKPEIVVETQIEIAASADTAGDAAPPARSNP